REGEGDAEWESGIAVGGTLGSRGGGREHANEHGARKEDAEGRGDAEDGTRGGEHGLLIRSAAQSYFIPVSFTTVDQRCASLRMKAENSAGVLVAGNRPEASAFALMAGSARILATSACSLSTIAA